LILPQYSVVERPGFFYDEVAYVSRLTKKGCEVSELYHGGEDSAISVSDTSRGSAAEEMYVSEGVTTYCISCSSAPSAIAGCGGTVSNPGQECSPRVDSDSEMCYNVKEDVG
jgi:hypothetical protein